MPGYGGYEQAARVLSPEQYCFLINKETNSSDRLEFQLMPDAISENKSAMYNEIPIIGRSLPLLGYSSSSSRMVSLSLRFVSLNEEGNGKYSPRWVEEQVRWLESKVYPRYEGAITYPPPRLDLFIGYALGMQCIMQSYNTTWMGPWAISEGGVARPFQAMVDIQLQEYGQNNDQYPYGHASAESGDNQLRPVSKSDPYVQIPNLLV
jgi:hypothetical protein